MNYGKIIYHNRKKLGWTQENLCEGICSVSHLSKIENGTKEAGIETIELLLRKMNVEIEENELKLEDVMIQLKKLWNSIERTDYEISKTLYEKLITKEEAVRYTSISNEYQLTIWRYYIFIEDLKKAKKKWKELDQNSKKFSQYELSKFMFTLSLYYIKVKKYSDVLLIMDELQELAPNIEIEFQEYCFYRAIVYHILNQTSLSMYFCNKAIPIFVQNNNIKRILDAKMLLSLQLIRSNLLVKAEILLEEVVDSSLILSDNTIHINALHNLGFLYHHSNQNEKAIEFYQSYLSHIHESSEEYFNVISNIVNNMIILKDYDSAIELLECNLIKIKDQNNPIYIRMKVLYLEAIKEEAELVEYLREVALPLWIKLNDSDKLMRYYCMVNNYYEKNKSIEEQNNLLKEYNSVLLNVIESRK